MNCGCILIYTTIILINETHFIKNNDSNSDRYKCWAISFKVAHYRFRGDERKGLFTSSKIKTRFRYFTSGYIDINDNLRYIYLHQPLKTVKIAL